MEHVACNLCLSDDSEVIQEDVRGRFRQVVCRRCGLVYLNPRMDREEARAFYLGYVQQYPRSYLVSPENNWYRAARQRFDFFRQQLDLSHPGKVLEIGCSYGYFLKHFGEIGWEAYGVEPSVEAAHFAAEEFGLTQVWTSPFEELELAPGEFDLVVMFHVAEHLRDPRETVRRVRKVLKEGGLLALDVPNAYTLPTTIMEFFYLVTSQHLYTFSPITLRGLLASEGFQVLLSGDHSLPLYASNLRALARKEGPVESSGGEASPGRHTEASLPNAQNGPWEVASDYPRIVGFMREYHARIQGLKVRLEGKLARWKEGSQRVLIYGAGFHTQGLAQFVDLSQAPVIGLLDDDEEKWGKEMGGWRVYPPDAVESLGVDAVLISSLGSEEEIYRKLKRYEGRGIEIARIYGEEREA